MRTREYLLEKAKNEGIMLGVKTERSKAEKLKVRADLAKKKN